MKIVDSTRGFRMHVVIEELGVDEGNGQESVKHFNAGPVVVAAIVVIVLAAVLVAVFNPFAKPKPVENSSTVVAEIKEKLAEKTREVKEAVDVQPEVVAVAVEQPAPESAPEPEVVEQPASENVEPVQQDFEPVLPTKQIARYKDVAIMSPITNAELTGVLFHQASYAYGLVMETELPEAVEEASSDGTRINHGQVDGVWLDADALHLYRWQDSTNMDTSIDVGADPGTVVYAPVSGTVVLVKDYLLYGYVPDVEIHIQPEGHPELDVVLLHQYDPMVKAGDKVVAGTTGLSHVRDISASLTGIQLDDYDGPEHLGNHSHVQINDANWQGYREEKLAGAYVPAG